MVQGVAQDVIGGYDDGVNRTQADQGSVNDLTALISHNTRHQYRHNNSYSRSGFHRRPFSSVRVFRKKLVLVPSSSPSSSTKIVLVLVSSSSSRPRKFNLDLRKSRTMTTRTPDRPRTTSSSPGIHVSDVI